VAYDLHHLIPRAIVAHPNPALFTIFSRKDMGTYPNVWVLGSGPVSRRETFFMVAVGLLILVAAIAVIIVF
jgi:hypothetical protein